ncbi:MAG: hypothetical protein D6736_00545 [Nitrospinota bacterium]|nr:MAG: hypothetical protein D6736_00545 [Nitrospinota bacterium]
MTFVFLDPRQGPKYDLLEPAPRLPSLKGKRLGILWNNRPGGDRLLRYVAEILHQKYELAEIYFTKKPFIGNEAPPEVLEDLASRVDAAVVGLGD